jgi:predicted phage terminase large subunit-like protein
VTATLTPDQEQHLRRVATPTRLGKFLVEGDPGCDHKNCSCPLHWGPKEHYDLDPWLLLMERSVLDAVLDENVQRFIRIHVPPQVGKTTFSALWLPFWLLGMNPELRIILVTYSDDYSRVRGGEVRDLVKAYGKALFGIEVDSNNDAAGDWKLKGHRGGMLSVGIDSQMAGRSGDVVIIDDTIKNSTEAASQATKSSQIRTFDSVIRPRLQPGGTMIMTTTRWADDDLPGVIGQRCRAKGYKGDEWEVLSFPAICDIPDDMAPADITPEWRDILGRKLGEELECRFTKSDPVFFERLKNTVEAFEFSCIWQQQPVSPTGGMFPQAKWKRYRRSELPEMFAKVRVWDPAASEGGGDWSVGTLTGKGSDGNYYVLDVQWFKKSGDQVLEAATLTADIDGYSVPIFVEQERAGAGKAIVALWSREMPAHQVEAAKADGSKEDRAKPYSQLQQSGRVFIPHDDEGEEWVGEFIDQHRKMMGDGRRGKHDDMIDPVAYGIRHLLDFGRVEIYDPYASNFDAETQMEALLQQLGLAA